MCPPPIASSLCGIGSLVRAGQVSEGRRAGHRQRGKHRPLKSPTADSASRGSSSTGGQLALIGCIWLHVTGPSLTLELWLVPFLRLLGYLYPVASREEPSQRGSLGPFTINGLLMRYQDTTCIRLWSPSLHTLQSALNLGAWRLGGLDDLGSCCIITSRYESSQSWVLW